MFQRLIDQLHQELTLHGLPEVAPTPGFAMYQIGGGATAVELAEQ
ncbi:MAG: hypothetical protein ABI206_11070 [Antricoccus sp.]